MATGSYMTPIYSRSQSEVLGVLHTSETNEAKSSFVKLQRMDESLRSVWGQAENKQSAYDIDDRVLVHTESICGENVKQVVFPTCKREEVMRVAHEIPLAGHLGESKTKQRIKYSFFWPKLKQDVRSFCQSCKTCQLRRGLTYRDRIPITPIVRPETHSKYGVSTALALWNHPLAEVISILSVLSMFALDGQKLYRLGISRQKQHVKF
ncbi:retrovirus-related Pol polyprotein from transposon 412 [Trichonephila clavipes]|nr:retrovirus-related Pol polyprotein from transposon 412 [Trichonephila clavipes]